MNSPDFGIVIRSLENLQVFSRILLSRFPEGAVILLSGDLGVGKTTLVRYCLEAMEGKPVAVKSPSFVIYQSYPRAEHFDLYRLDNVGPQALVEIGYFDALEKAKDGKGYVFVEWPEKVVERKALQGNCLVEMKLRGENERWVGVTML